MHKLINGDIYRNISDYELAQFLLNDSCCFNNSTKIQNAKQIVLDDMKTLIDKVEKNIVGPRIRKYKHDNLLAIYLKLFNDIFSNNTIKAESSNYVGQHCKALLKKQYDFKYIEMAHILDYPKNPILYTWLGNICAISKPNKAYTDCGSNGIGRDNARKIWQNKLLLMVKDSIDFYNNWLERSRIKCKIAEWLRSNKEYSKYQDKIIGTFSNIIV